MWPKTFTTQLIQKMFTRRAVKINNLMVANPPQKKNRSSTMSADACPIHHFKPRAPNWICLIPTQAHLSPPCSHMTMLWNLPSCHKSSLLKLFRSLTLQYSHEDSGHGHESQGTRAKVGQSWRAGCDHRPRGGWEEQDSLPSNSTK